MGSGGGVIVQPLLGKAADVWGYPASYLCGATIQLLASPFHLAGPTRAARSLSSSQGTFFTAAVDSEQLVWTFLAKSSGGAWQEKCAYGMDG